MRTRSRPVAWVTLLFLVSTFTLAQTEYELRGEVAVGRELDLFTDEETWAFTIGADGDPIRSLTFVPARALTTLCEDGAVTAMMFTFDEYLNSGDYGPFEYRVDSGEVVSLQAWQDDDNVLLIVREGQFGDSSSHVRAILAGDQVAVRATSWDGDRDQALFYLGALRSTMNEAGCAF